MDGEASAGAFRRPRPVTLHELVHQVASCDWSHRQGVTHTAVAAVWGALCDVVAASIAAGTGVKLPGLGSFWPAPAFVVLRTLRTVRGGVPNECACGRRACFCGRARVCSPSPLTACAPVALPPQLRPSCR
jgi:hypothetical protein